MHLNTLYVYEQCILKYESINRKLVLVNGEAEDSEEKHEEPVTVKIAKDAGSVMMRLVLQCRRGS